jgi:hypothetical protein
MQRTTTVSYEVIATAASDDFFLRQRFAALTHLE